MGYVGQIKWENNKEKLIYLKKQFSLDNGLCIINIIYIKPGNG